MKKNSFVGFLIILCITLTAVLVFSMVIPRCSAPWNWGGGSLPDTVTISDTLYVYDTIPVEVKVPVPVPYYVDKPADIPPEIINPDSCCIELFSKAYYRDTLMNDSIALIVLEDTIFRNRTGQRSLTYINRRPVQIVNTTTTIVTHSPGGVFPGAAITVPFAVNEKTGFSVGVLYMKPQQRSKSEKQRYSVFGTSWDFVNKRLSLSYNFKL